MGARFYDSALGRWLSADQIVPDSKNPQAWNRYSYVYNRPLVAIDKSGHNPWFPMIDGLYTIGYSGQIPANPRGPMVMEAYMPLSAKERRQRLHDYAKRELAEGATSLEAWASTCDYAAKLSDGDPDIFMRDVSRVLTGYSQKTAPFHWLTQKVVGKSPYKVTFRTDGFLLAYADPDAENDQVHHTWFYTQIAYTWGQEVADYGNVFHEFGPLQTGQSGQDLMAGYLGAYLGYLLREGLISIDEVGDWIREQLGEPTDESQS